MELIENNIETINRLCQKHKVNRLFVFGSILTSRFNDQSDIDLIIEFKKTEISDYFTNFFDFKDALQSLFGRDIDLLEEQPLRNPYLKQSIDTIKAQIYGSMVINHFPVLKKEVCELLK